MSCEWHTCLTRYTLKSSPSNQSSPASVDHSFGLEFYAPPDQALTPPDQLKPETRCLPIKPRNPLPPDQALKPASSRSSPKTCFLLIKPPKLIKSGFSTKDFQNNYSVHKQCTFAKDRIRISFQPTQSGACAVVQHSGRARRQITAGNSPADLPR